jgi:flagellar motor switch protein FliM
VTISPTAPPSGVVQRLLGAIGSTGPVRPDVEAAEYDWQVPCRFRRAQMDRLAEFGQLAAGKISTVLAALLRSNINLAAGPVAEQYASAVLSDLAEAQALHLPLVRGRTPCGLVVLSAETAMSWLSSLLGGMAESVEVGRELSPVDRELLTDVGRTIGQAVAAAVAECGGSELEVEERIGQATAIPPGMETQEYCRFSFSLVPPGGEDAEAEPEEQAQEQEGAPADAVADPVVDVLLVSEVAAELADGGKAGTVPVQAQDLRGRMRDYVGNAVIPATVVLGAAELSVGEILSLEPGDVLVLESGTAGPAVLRVQERDILVGAPVQSDGMYALRVTAMSAGAMERSDEDGR